MLAVGHSGGQESRATGNRRPATPRQLAGAARSPPRRCVLHVHRPGRFGWGVDAWLQAPKYTDLPIAAVVANSQSAGRLAAGASAAGSGLLPACRSPPWRTQGVVVRAAAEWLPVIRMEWPHGVKQRSENSDGQYRCEKGRRTHGRCTWQRHTARTHGDNIGICVVACSNHQGVQRSADGRHNVAMYDRHCLGKHWAGMGKTH